MVDQTNWNDLVYGLDEYGQEDVHISDEELDFAMSELELDDEVELQADKQDLFLEKKELLTHEQEIDMGFSMKRHKILEIEACLKLDANIELLAQKLNYLADGRMGVNDVFWYVHDYTILKDDDDRSTLYKLWKPDKNIDLDVVNDQIKFFNDNYQNYKSFKSFGNVIKANECANKIAKVVDILRLNQDIEDEMKSYTDGINNVLQVNKKCIWNLAREEKLNIPKFRKIWLDHTESNKYINISLLTERLDNISPNGNLSDRGKKQFEKSFLNLSAFTQQNFTTYGLASNIINERKNAVKNYLDVRDKMCLANTGLVYSISNKYNVGGVEMDDLVQGGIEGLLTVIDRYDPRFGYKLSSYAVRYITNDVLAARQETTGIISIPKADQDVIISLNRTLEKLKQSQSKPTIKDVVIHLHQRNIEQKLLNKTGQKPSKEETELEILKKVNEVEKIVARYTSADHMGSLNYLVGEESPLIDMVADSKSIDIDSSVGSPMVSDYIKLIRGLLSKQEHIAINHFYPEDNYKLTDIQAVVKAGGVPIGRLKDIAEKGIKRLNVISKLPKDVIKEMVFLKEQVRLIDKNEISSIEFAKELNVSVNSVDKLSALMNEIGINAGIKVREGYDLSSINKFIENIQSGKSYNDDLNIEIGLTSNEASFNRAIVKSVTDELMLKPNVTEIQNVCGMSIKGNYQGINDNQTRFVKVEDEMENEIMEINNKANISLQVNF